MGKTVFRNPADYYHSGRYHGEPTYLPLTKKGCLATCLLFLSLILTIIAIAVTLGGREEGAHRLI